MVPFDSLGGQYSLQTASEVKSDPRFEISDINYLHIHIHIAYMVWALLAASEATTASKQPQRSKLCLQVKLATPIYFITKFQGIFISQKMTLLSDDNQRPLTCVAIAAGKNYRSSIAKPLAQIYLVPQIIKRGVSSDLSYLLTLKFTTR